MKLKQALLIPILSLAMLVSLTGCIMIPRYKHYDIVSDKVTSIEIYNLRDSEAYPSSETLVYTIENNQMADFLSDLSDIRFSDTIIITIAAIDPSFNYGIWTVRINYTDGSYSFISCAGYGETYDANDQKIEGNHFGCDNDEWEKFIGKYVPQDIFKAQ